MPAFATSQVNASNAGTFNFGRPAPNGNPFGQGQTTQAKQTGTAFGQLSIDTTPKAQTEAMFNFGQTNNSAVKGFDLSAASAPRGGQSGTWGLIFSSTSTPSVFGTSNQTPAFGSAYPAPAFESANQTLAFGSSSQTQAFGSANTAPTFGATTQSPVFGSAIPTFGVAANQKPNTPVFGAPVNSSSRSVFGSTGNTGTGISKSAAMPAFTTSHDNASYAGVTPTAGPAFGAPGAYPGTFAMEAESRAPRPPRAVARANRRRTERK